MKHLFARQDGRVAAPAAFRRLCVETRGRRCGYQGPGSQPPSGGCVLKLSFFARLHCLVDPAAFRRLCVETSPVAINLPRSVPAAFRRLCVETLSRSGVKWYDAPAAFRRLCVETRPQQKTNGRQPNQPPSGGCVLKLRYHSCLICTPSSRLQAAVC